MCAEDVTTTYLFTNRDWNATCDNEAANWTCNVRAGGFTAGQGTQVTTSSTGANATSPISFTDVKEIVVTYCTNSSKGQGAIKVKVGVGTEQSFTVTKPSSGGTTLKTATFSFDPEETGTVTLTVDCDVNSIYIYSIAITEADNGGSTLETSDLALTDAPVDLEFDLFNNSSAQTVIYTTSGSGAVTVSGGTGYVTTSVDVTNKTITVTPTTVTPSAQTITVKQAADETYAAGSVTFTVSVTDSTPFAGGDITFTAGTDVGSTTGNNSEDQMTKSVVTISSTDAAFAAEQYRLYQNSATTFTTSQGKISKIVFTQSGSYAISNLTPDVGSLSNATWTGSATSVTFTASAQARASKIVVTVDMTNKAEPNFSFGETTSFTVNPNAEFTAPTLTYAQGFDGTIVYASSDEDVALVDEQTGEVVIGSIEGTATITATSAATDNFYAGSASYTINVVDSREEAGLAWSAAKVDIDKEATSYTLPTLTNDNNLTVTYSSSNEDIAVVDESTGETVVETSALGTATITATFAGNATYKPGTASYIINIVDPNANDGSIDKPYTVADIKAGVTNTSGVYVKGFIVGNYNATAPITGGNNFTDTNLALADTPNETDGSMTIPVELTSANSMRTNWGPSNKPYNIAVAQVLVKGNIISYFGVQGIKQSKDITKIAEQVTVSSVGVGTYSTDVSLDFSESGITACTAVANGTSVALTEISSSVVPANAGVVLKADGGASALVPVVDSDATLSDNEMEPNVARALVAKDGADGKTNYILSNEAAGVGFYLAADGDGAYLPAHRAYLSTTATASAPFLSFDEGTTGIGATLNDNGEMINDKVYDLSGRRVAQPTKGIYIINGKKVVVK